MPRLQHLILPLALILAACGGPGHEDTLTYQVHLGAGDVTGSSITEDIHIDPNDAYWQNFLNQARNTLGEAPTRFDVTNVRLQLAAPKSRNVSMIQDLFSGDVTVFLRANDSGTQVDIAELEEPQGSAQVSMGLTRDDLEPLNANLLRSDFRLGLRGSTPKQASSDFDATVIVTLDITAR
jgi:hypothetical protein